MIWFYSKSIAMTNLEKFETQHKKSIFNAISSNLSLWLDEFVHVMWFGKKSKNEKDSFKNQVSLSDDKYENNMINKKK